MEEIIIREFVGGSDDGMREVVPPDADQFIVRTSKTHFFDDSDRQPPEEVYEFSHEEIEVVRIKKWVYKRKSETD